MPRTPRQIIGEDALVQLIFEGYAVVPREPTTEMLDAADSALNRWRATLTGDEKLLRHTIKDGRGYTEATVPEKHAIRWRAMLAAAPGT